MDNHRAGCRADLDRLSSVAHPDGGRVTPQPGAKALALLTYLTLEPRPHTREALADLFWGESPEAEARASLRQVLKQLRDSLGEVVQSRPAAGRLAEPVRCDVTRIPRQGGPGAGGAAAIDIPRFLAGFSIRHAPQFDDWVAETRSGLLQRYAASSARSPGDAMDQRRWREAAERADPGWLLIAFPRRRRGLAIEARYLAGDRGAALAKLAEYRAALLRERVRALQRPDRPGPADRNRRRAGAPQPIRRRVVRPRSPFEASLIGRADEWSAW